MNTITFFAKQFAAFVTGDDVQVRALKQFRKAESALKTQIAVNEGETIAKEEAVQQAGDALASALVNGGNDITDASSYVRNLLDAQNSVTSAGEAIAKHQAKLDFLKSSLAKLQETVEA